MSFFKFLKEKMYLIVTFFILYGILLLMFFAFKLSSSCIVAITFLLFIFLFSIIFIEYFRKRSFYTNLLDHIHTLDQAYLVLEMIDKPTFLEGMILYQALYDINKSMNENVKLLQLQMNDFKEYIEMWIHEIKIPIASLFLTVHNHKDKFDKKILEQLKRIEIDVEQVLYYVRCENAEKDYLISKVSLNCIIRDIALKNQDLLLENQIDFIVDEIHTYIYTDSKWLEFILNQIINNSVKYKRDFIDSYIKIMIKETLDQTIIIIEDNGIGIPLYDISKVFEKSFTGYNGRIKTKSTGMGLFICKNLCEKLGHKIRIESEQEKYTRLYITIAKNRFYDVIT